MSNGSFAKPLPLSAWCQECQELVALTNLRSWPEGVLAIGDCPHCHAKLAVKKPVVWGGSPAA